MKNIFILLLVIIFLGIISCQKDDNSINNNNQADHYVPLTLNNWWKYNVTGPNLPATITYTVTKDTNINGKVWQQVTNTFSNEQIPYYRYEGNVFWILLLNKSGDVVVKYPCFTDVSKVGDSIVSDTTIGSIIARTVIKIQEVGTTRTVVGKTYTDVMKTAYITSFSNDNGVSWSEGTLLTEYYSRNIGLIEMELEGIMKRGLIEYNIVK